MMCPHCKNRLTKFDLTNMQEDKDDLWLCTCGDMHKGFPYDCPRKWDKYKELHIGG